MKNKEVLLLALIDTRVSWNVLISVGLLIWDFPVPALLGRILEGVGLLFVKGWTRRIVITVGGICTRKLMSNTWCARGLTIAPSSLIFLGTLLLTPPLGLSDLRQHGFEGFNPFLEDCWDSVDTDLSRQLSQFKDAVVSWNKEVFGFIPPRKKRLLARLRGI